MVHCIHVDNDILRCVPARLELYLGLNFNGVRYSSCYITHIARPMHIDKKHPKVQFHVPIYVGGGEYE